MKVAMREKIVKQQGGIETVQVFSRLVCSALTQVVMPEFRLQALIVNIVGLL